MQLNIYTNDPPKVAEACVIWMHGIGADAQDMMGLASQLPVKSSIRHIFLDAPLRPVTLNNGMVMRAWYDIVGMELTDRQDREGILQSAGLVRAALDQQINAGFLTKQIFLAGFSQGGAMALYIGMNDLQDIGGLITLSAYLPLADTCQPVLHNLNTPIFMAGGRQDPIVLPTWQQQTANFLRNKGFDNIEQHEYAMAHEVCSAEIIDLANWLDKQVSSIHHVLESAYDKG